MPISTLQTAAQPETCIPRRPPGARSGGFFRDLCLRCGDCVAVCPLRALTPDIEGFPRLIDNHACTDCGLCADVCTPGALELTAATRIGLRATQTAERRSATPRLV